jgi:outer membrane protein FlgP
VLWAVTDSSVMDDAMHCMVDRPGIDHEELQMASFKRIAGAATITTAIAGAVVLAGCQTRPAPMPVPEPLPTRAAPAATAELTTMAPLVERRDTLIATGYAVIAVQNHRSPAQQRLLAIRASKLDAYRALTEQVYGQYLDATTTVADMVVMSDTFRARVEGVIYGAVLVSITPVNDDTYETTLSLDRSVANDLRLLYLTQLAAKRK